MIKVAVAGDFQDGKSTLINAMCGCNRAETGFGIATTKEVREYLLTGTGITLIDTPGFNADDDDNAQACVGIEQADACFYMLSNTQFTGRMFRGLKNALKYPDGSYKPLIPFINDRGCNNKGMAKASIASMRFYGLEPILFGDEMPVIHAEDWQKGCACEAECELGMRRIKFLLGMEPVQRVSPLEKICILNKIC